MPEPLTAAQTTDTVEGEAPAERQQSTVSIAKFKSLKRRVEMLEAAICDMRG